MIIEREKKDKVKIGWVGVGRRGSGVLKNCFCRMSDIEIVALCEKNPEALQKGLDILKERGREEQPITTSDYSDIINNPDIDAVILMTDWHDRVALAIQAMEAGKYTAIEVGAAFDLSECFQLVDAYERTGSPVMLMENACYCRREMMTYNVAEQGLFGEIVHCDGAYGHFLNECELFADLSEDGTSSHYRIKEYISRNCEQYPTHELGPISKILKLNRGNRMLTLSAFSSKSRGLKAYAKKHLGEDSPYANIDYKQGDIFTTMITCANGETIHLVLDTTVPRPYYSRDYTVRGTTGMYTEERKVLYFDHMEENVENNEEEMFELYEHPLHKEYVKEGATGGHGGVDWLVSRAFVESVKKGTNTPIDAYDSALWMAIGPLSEMSINRGGAPVSVPDFTRGKWLRREPIVEGKYCLDKVCVDEETKIYPDKKYF